jgi:hypothetical protein
VEIAGQAEWYSSPVHDRSLWQVAWDGDQVAGQVLPMMEHGHVVIDGSAFAQPGAQGLAFTDLRLRDIRPRLTAIR